MSKIIFFTFLLVFFIACNNDSQVDVGIEYNILEEKAQRPQYQNTTQDSIIIGTEESQESVPVDKLNVEPKFVYKQKTGKIKWIKADYGLDYAEMDAPIRCNIGDSKITIIRINPQHYEFQLLSSKEIIEDIKTIDEWANKHGLVAAINAGIFRADYATSTGYMKNYDFLNNPVLHKEYKAIAAFNPIDDNAPLFQIIDLECQDWDELKDSYHSYVQSLRMIDCDGKNKWSEQKKYWSIAALAQDEDKNVLFLFSRTPYSVYDFNEIIRHSVLNVTQMMYLEGGPEASIYLNYEEHQIKKMGSYETNFRQNDLNDKYWEIPNVIGVKKLKED